MRPIIFTYKYWVKFSILAWRIPGTEEPGGPQSMESQRVGYDLETEPPPPQQRSKDKS